MYLRLHACVIDIKSNNREQFSLSVIFTFHNGANQEAEIPDKGAEEGARWITYLPETVAPGKSITAHLVRHIYKCAYVLNNNYYYFILFLHKASTSGIRWLCLV